MQSMFLQMVAFQSIAPVFVLFLGLSLVLDFLITIYDKTELFATFLSYCIIILLAILLTNTYTLTSIYL